MWVMAHSSHDHVVRRLRRAHGHLASVIAMIEAAQPCLELAQQLHAVESAIQKAKTTLIHDHLDHCMRAAQRKRGAKAKASLSEFKTITKYL